MSILIKSKGSLKTIANNNLIDSVDWDANYDGVNLDVIATNKNKQLYIKLDNDDIYELLNLKSHPESLEKNLRSSLKNDKLLTPIYLNKKKKCKKGTKRNKKSGLCVSKKTKKSKKLEILDTIY